MSLGSLELAHLLTNIDFLNTIKEDFTQEEVNEINNYIKDKNSGNPDVIDAFLDWLNFELEENGNTVLLIAWDSHGWGPGGNGCVRFKVRFGIVRMDSSDYDDDHVEIFNKENFYPWGIESLMNDYIELRSDIYDEKELIELANNMGMEENTELTVNGKLIER